MPNPIKVFISYSHDSDEHRERVLELSNRLRSHKIDCEIDQYEILPEEGWERWMEKQIEKAHFVLTVCTKRYKDSFSGAGEIGRGVNREGIIISGTLYEKFGKNKKFIPVVFCEDDKEFVPIILKNGNCYNAIEDADFQKLLNHLNNFNPTARPPLPEDAIPFNIPFHRNPYFTGREDIFEKLKENLESSKQTELTQVLSGMGGVGKTQIAAEFAYCYRDSYEAVLWVDAESEASLANSVGDIAHLLDLPQKNQPERDIVRQAVQKWLITQNNWLLILDNVEDMKLYNEFIPTSALGHIIITTRLPTAGKIKKLFVNEMNDDGVLFLLRRTGAVEDGLEIETSKPEDLVSAKRINELFGGLALALEQAGAYVEENGISLSRYLKLYDLSGSQLLAEEDGGRDYPEPVARAFDLSLKKTEENSRSAFELIQLCAFLEPDSIPELVFKNGQKHLGSSLKKAIADDIQWQKTIKEACRFSLLQRNADEESFRMHRLIQQVVRDSHKNPKKIALKAIKALNESFPNAEFETWELCGFLLPTFQSIQDWIKKWDLETSEVSRLYSCVGYYFEFAQGRYEDAEPFYLAALEMRKKLLGDEHPDVATSLNNLAGIHESQGRYEDAEPFYLAALEMRKKLLGDEHPDVATSLNNLAGLYEIQGRYEEGEPLYQTALETRKKLLGEEHPDVAASLNDLAILYDRQGRYQEAESLYLKAIEMWKKLLGEEHPSISNSLNNLAVLYRKQGRYEEAEPLYLEAFEIRKKLFGEEHPDVATSLNNLGIFWGKQGNYSKAEGYLEQAYSLLVELLGAEHPHSIKCKESLEWVRSKMG